MRDLEASLSQMQASWDRILELGRRAGPVAEKRAQEFVTAQMARVRGQVDGLMAEMASGK